MNGGLAIPAYDSTWSNRAVVLEAVPGLRRGAVVDQWLGQAGAAGAAPWRLACAFDEGGVFAGLISLIDDLVPRIQALAPELITKHSYELGLIHPPLQAQLANPTASLTDRASEEEKVRNYAADRAYRSLHGLIDLLADWHAFIGAGPWVIACDDYDRASGILQRFFAEWLRRRGQRMGLTLLLVVAPGNAQDALSRMPLDQRLPTMRLASDPTDADGTPTITEWSTRAEEIERELRQTPSKSDALLPPLIHCLEKSGADRARILRLRIEAMRSYNHQGLYEAAAVYGPAVEDQLAVLADMDPLLHDLAVEALFFAYVPIGQVERAYHMLNRELGDRPDDPTYLPRMYYLLAMLHARFLKPGDLRQAESLLDRALAHLHTLPADALLESRRVFLTVFTMNGMALVRVRQRRPEAAVELCRKGIALLNEHLRPDEHRLHRSVLEYNIAQVYAQIGPYDQALQHFTASMTMDPNYSEYYNERGSVLLKLGRLAEAEQDFQRAIELSPPYPEVWTNLGQCYRAMERLPDAIAAYSRALDLDPTVTLALVGRADASATMGDVDRALADYAAALALAPEESVLYASRAIIWYESGLLTNALADLDAAIRLAPDEADYYQNRAVALADLGRVDDAVADLRTYLQLSPHAEDRSEVENRLVQLALLDSRSAPIPSRA